MNEETTPPPAQAETQDASPRPPAPGDAPRGAVRTGPPPIPPDTYRQAAIGHCGGCHTIVDMGHPRILEAAFLRQPLPIKCPACGTERVLTPFGPVPQQRMVITPNEARAMAKRNR